ncbi:hypothetical protein ACFO0M_10040 [Micromonospora mangrovi]|uniref:Uncharacterized protein n=2 Tax=Micromonospora TaxID=1873 RepID=A0AAU7M6B5_9ACTN
MTSTPVAYISIGNSDDKLTQREWADFVWRVALAVQEASEYAGGGVHGQWMSLPADSWQNACWALQLPADPAPVDRLRAILAGLAAEFRQDSIAWALAPTTEFLNPPPRS